MHKQSFGQRSLQARNPAAIRLLQLMEKKRSNLAVSLDVLTAAELLNFAELLGPEICVLKTHIDIILDFHPGLTQELRRLAETYNFLIFEDRKFADIGHTVSLQYGDGIYRIADWAHITNAHGLPGPGIIDGLKEVGLEKGNGLLLLAQMSSKDNLIDEAYIEATLKMAKDHPEFVIGFVAQQRLSDDPSHIYFTPGVNLAEQGDHWGQQYNTPESVINNGSDVIIVGRGIYGAANPLAMAQTYRQQAWEAYEQQLSKCRVD